MVRCLPPQKYEGIQLNDTTKGTGRLIVYKASESQPKDRRRHYIPAHLIGSFSSNGVLLPKRNRPICVVRLATQQTRTDLAKNVGLKKGIYGYGKGSTFDHDDMFKSSEKGSGQPVDNLAAASFDKLLADDWIHLADYVASQITRGPDAEYELEANIQREGWDASRVSMGYPMNYLRISTAVIRAEWEFVKTLRIILFLETVALQAFTMQDEIHTVISCPSGEVLVSDCIKPRLISR